MKGLMADLKQTNSEKILLSWVRQSTNSYPQVNVVNFSSSWENGLAFNALIHSHRLVLSVLLSEVSNLWAYRHSNSKMNIDFFCTLYTFPIN